MASRKTGVKKSAPYTSLECLQVHPITLRTCQYRFGVVATRAPIYGFIGGLKQKEKQGSQIEHEVVRQ